MVERPGAEGRERTRWHALSVADAFGSLNSGVAGLSNEEAEQRLIEYGENRLEEAPGVSRLRLLLTEFTSPLILILIGAAVVLFAVAGAERTWDHVVDASLILAIVLANGALGFIQNFRAEAGIASLRRLASPRAAVLRAGQQLTGDA